jgi:hypothetical protein
MQLRLVTSIVTALSLASCQGVSQPKAQGLLGAISGNENSTVATMPTHDVRHVRPPDSPSGQLRWGMKF